MFISTAVTVQPDSITHLNTTRSNPDARTALRPAIRPLALVPAVRALGILALALWLAHASQAQTILGSAGGYAVMGGGAVTVTGTGTTITGNLGVGGTFTNGGVTFGATGGLVTPLAAQNITDFDRAFSGLAAMTGAVNLTGQTLGASVNNLVPGVYKFTTAAAMTGNLVLDAQNQSNAVWVFQMASTFNTTASKTVTFINTVGDPVANYGLFWQVSGATVFGASTMFEGNLLVGSTIDLGAGVHIDHGRALTATGTIGLATDTIDFITAASGYSGGLAFVGASNVITAVPEPATYAFFAGVIALATVVIRRRLPRAVAQA